jgi:beta-galactosidase
MMQVSTNDEVTRATEESHALLDVSGINYGHSRYETDRELFPNRIIVGTETFPEDIDELWRLVRENAHVIGDFTWTGWDYLGEAGIGRVDYPDEDYVPTGISAPYPWLTGWVGDIDITGHRRPASYYRETVFGLRHEPDIAVHRPQFHGRFTSKTPGPGPTRCRAGAGTSTKDLLPPSTSTATPMRSNCCSTAARSAAPRSAPTNRSSPAST